MGLETAQYISDLVISNPEPLDNVSQGDDHLRLIKSVLLETLLNADQPRDLAKLDQIAVKPIITVYDTAQAAQTHTFTEGKSWYKVIVTGGGGGGYAENAGRGGTGAGTTMKTADVPEAGTATFTVGDGGGIAFAGEDSTWDDGEVQLVAEGGERGASSQNDPGSGGFASGGDLNIRGGGAEQASAGMGGASYWSGGNASDAASGLNNLGAYGTGGRGGSGTQGTRPGISGVIYIEEH